MIKRAIDDLYRKNGSDRVVDFVEYQTEDAEAYYTNYQVKTKSGDIYVNHGRTGNWEKIN